MAWYIQQIVGQDGLDPYIDGYKQKEKEQTTTWGLLLTKKSQTLADLA